MDAPTLTAAGLASSLGGIVTGAAAFRAGITRATDLAWLASTSTNGEREPISGHPARPLVEGLDGFAVWLRLALLAWDDCWRSAGPASARLPGGRLDGLGMIVVLPRIVLGRYAWEVDDPRALLDEHFTSALLSRLGLVIPPEHRVVIAADHVGTALALGVARERFAQGHWRRAVVLAVDSLLDPSSIMWLGELGRLKSGRNPNGLIPGEAAVCLLVESPGQKYWGSDTGVQIGGTATLLSEPPPPEHQLSPMDRALALKSLIPRCGIMEDAAPIDHYLDHTGEEWRAIVWGNLLATSRIAGSPARDNHTWLPAGGFGATGAASGALAIALALRAYQRGYAAADQALVWSMTEASDAGLVHLRYGRSAP